MLADNRAHEVALAEYNELEQLELEQCLRNLIAESDNELELEQLSQNNAEQQELTNEELESWYNEAIAQYNNDTQFIQDLSSLEEQANSEIDSHFTQGQLQMLLEVSKNINSGAITTFAKLLRRLISCLPQKKGQTTQT